MMSDSPAAHCEIPVHAVVQENDRRFVFIISGNQAVSVMVISGDMFNNLISSPQRLTESNTIVTPGMKNLNGRSDL
jgi:hypothetical protein